MQRGAGFISTTCLRSCGLPSSSKAYIPAPNLNFSRPKMFSIYLSKTSKRFDSSYADGHSSPQNFSDAELQKRQWILYEWPSNY